MKASFEDKMKKLESIAEKMEKGDLHLEQGLKLYEEGVKLSAELDKELAAAKLKIEELQVQENSE
ncbi:MAG: exodeoxyribonuclease VII small subunit [Oscillospiraceae bacterium]|nr:exodeoxyribonuclease VII small subunit [Oscillospiraceae bacterium]